jgi:hypothetical protein
LPRFACLLLLRAHVLELQRDHLVQGRMVRSLSYLLTALVAGLIGAQLGSNDAAPRATRQAESQAELQAELPSARIPRNSRNPSIRLPEPRHTPPASQPRPRTSDEQAAAREAGTFATDQTANAKLLLGDARREFLELVRRHSVWKLDDSGRRVEIVVEEFAREREAFDKRTRERLRGVAPSHAIAQHVYGAMGNRSLGRYRMTIGLERTESGKIRILDPDRGRREHLTLWSDREVVEDELPLYLARFRPHVPR